MRVQGRTMSVDRSDLIRGQLLDAAVVLRALADYSPWLNSQSRAGKPGWTARTAKSFAPGPSSGTGGGGGAPDLVMHLLMRLFGIDFKQAVRLLLGPSL